MSSYENSEVSITGTLRYEDYKKYSEYHNKKIVIGYFLCAFIVSTFVLAFSTVLLFPGWARVLVLTMSLVISLVLSGALTLTLILLIRLRGRREYKSDAAVQTEMSYVINNQGIQQKRGKSNTYFEWNEILKAYENQEMFRLYVSKNKAIVLPKHFFNTKKDIELFKGIVQKNLDSQSIIFIEQ